MADEQRAPWTNGASKRNERKDDHTHETSDAEEETRVWERKEKKITQAQKQLN